MPSYFLLTAVSRHKPPAPSTNLVTFARHWFAKRHLLVSEGKS